MTSESERAEMYPIRARSHLLSLLGEELIGDDRLAVFELVKNGYDADAKSVIVTLNSRPGPGQKILVEDSGVGMNLADLTGKWLELATDSKRKDRSVRTKKYHRLPLGEKGVGRLACFKLGTLVTLTTRAADNPEWEVHINWDDLVSQGPYLEDLKVRVLKNTEPKYFDKRRTGTRIEISNLRRKVWARGDLRKLYRLISSLASPFDEHDEFKVEFRAPGREADIADMISPSDFLELATWKFRFKIADGLLDWAYAFSPPHWKGLEARSSRGEHASLLLTPEIEDDGTKRKSPESNESLVLRKQDQQGIGPIEGNIYAYYRRSEILNATGNSSQLSTWLNDQTGVRVYRDGVRVFNYGERSDDWLGLNLRRINAPGGKFGTNSIVAAVQLYLPDSYGLREKTNREGFDQNDAFERLRRIILSVVEQFERAHADDRKALDEFLKGTSNEKPVRFSDAIANLKSGLKEHKLDKSFARDIDAIEEEFTQLRDVMVNAGTAGLNLAVVFHEIERGVDTLASSVERGIEAEKIREQIDHLYQLLHGFAPLLKRNPSRLVFASEIVRPAYHIRESRFKFHKIVFSAPLLQGEEPDFKIHGPSGLLSGALGNLIDNAIYWTRVRKERDSRTTPAAILVASDWDKASNSGMIAVVDNGPGFSITSDRAVEAFYTTRPGGMGLGLYFASLVMEQCGGRLTIHSASELRDEIKISGAYDGAAVALRFGETK